MTEAVLDHIDRVMTQRPEARASLGAYRELVEIMVKERAAPALPAIRKDLQAVKREAGFPLFSREDLPVDWAAATRLLGVFLERLSEKERPDRGGLRKALEKLRENRAWAERLFKAVLRQDRKALSRMARAVELDRRTLLFFGEHALRPSLVALREASATEIDHEKWRFPRCPMCGSSPDMAFFTRSGKRYLHCGFCGQEWAYARLKCPFCENEEQTELGYFQPEGEERVRVDFCRRCKRYLKTVDTRVLEETAPMEVEHLATLHLDALAAREGFK
jgi:FdhE protein